MKILLAHNYTQGFATGGEGHVFEDEARLLEEHGHRVYKLICSNSEATEASFLGKLRAFWNAAWSKDGYKRMYDAIQEFKPDVVHIHNFFLIFSPSVFKAAYDLNIPVVVTLHNYRLVSPCSQLLRNNQICELCVGRNPWRIMLYKCYRDSFFASLLRYKVYYLSKKYYNWDKYVSLYFSLTEFGKNKLVQSGLSSSKILVLPNYVSDSLNDLSVNSPGNYALFIGRLSHEKGVEFLLDAWSEIDYPLIIVGDGPLRSKLEFSAPRHVKFVGLQSRETVLQYLQGCSFLVMPSIWYEGFGLVIIEAMSMGRAVVASRLGAMLEIVKDGVTGFHFSPNDISDFRSKVMLLINSQILLQNMGIAARNYYIENFTEHHHYNALIQYYNLAITKKLNIYCYT